MLEEGWTTTSDQGAFKMTIGDCLDIRAAIGGLQDSWTAAMDAVDRSNEGRDSSSAPGIVLDSNQIASKKCGQ
ncbi:hypothetical protein MA16_Dca006521 [Dendrobium catenatum]|uniref:Uncharacterized protein n=1 Tax=Dendrobium catenatum TaxID=906689 RepID=A0A2I0XGS3_9ASPA|nr:hypothetical protein MA16_Dca006521 [Dendrobium catenatum]